VDGDQIAGTDELWIGDTREGEPASLAASYRAGPRRRLRPGLSRVTAAEGSNGLTSEDLCTTWSLLGASSIALWISVPGVFAAGDVRSGSMKRVASAVGEGASAIRSVHLALAQGA
jgi:hypothetical protein